jgi:hypothetical protein
VMADKTDNLLTRDLMLEAVPYSVVNMDEYWDICVPSCQLSEPRSAAQASPQGSYSRH